MIQTFDIGSLHCLCCRNDKSDTLAYVLYPLDILQQWIEQAAWRYNTSIAVVTGIDWENALTPWPAPGVPKGSPDFAGDAPAFLRELRHDVLPAVESRMGLATAPRRDLVGVSLSGLFTLWQWMMCDTFRSIASLSGSFWYQGFAAWMASHPVPPKDGRAFFLLGDLEVRSTVKAFRSVADDTRAIIGRLRQSGVRTEFLSVPGNHYADPTGRLDKAFTSLYGNGD